MKRQLYYILIIMLLAVVPVYGQGAGVGSAPGIQLQDEGIGAGRVQILNCIGTGIACTKSGVTGAVTISGTSFTLTQIEVDFGTDGKFVHIETITDAAVSATSKIIFLQSGIAATSRQADENEMDGIICNAVPGTGNFVIECTCQRSVTHGKFKVNYAIG